MSEAIKLNLPKSNFLLAGYSLYFDDIHRSRAVFDIYHEGYKSFADSVLVKHCKELIDEVNIITQKLNNGENIITHYFPPRPYFDKLLKEWHLENLKIASGFELCLKAKILSKGFIVNVIDRKDKKYAELSKEQENRPIHIDELKNICDFIYTKDGSFLPGISKNSLKFSNITQKDKYRNILDLKKSHLDIIEEFRALRNIIHLTGGPGSVFFTTARSKLGEHVAEFIVRFINNEVVPAANAAGKSSNLMERFFLKNI